MKETFYRLALMVLFFAMLGGGAVIMQSTSKWTKQSQRSVLLVDAYEGYSTDTGKPYWKGIFRDKELNTRLEWNIEPRTFRAFAADGVPQDMVITANRGQVNDPTEPTGKQGLAGGMIFLGIGGFLFNLIAVIFFRDPYRWD